MSTNLKYKKLLEPGYIGKIKTRNRIIKTANGTSFIETSGLVGDKALAYYEALAKGGVGLLIVESCSVEEPLGSQHPPFQFHLDDDRYIPSYSELSKVIHKHGCPTILQLQHAGPWNPTGNLPKRDTKAASALTCEELPAKYFDIPRALSNAEVKEYIDIWAKAAERAAKAGFDGVEINGATCHQINTFFSRIWNKREDEYGYATIENRARFICDIVRRVKSNIGKDFTVTCLFNIAEFGNEKGTKFDEGIEFAKLIEQAGADAIQLRAYNYDTRQGLIHPERLFYPEPIKPFPSRLDWSHRGSGALTSLTVMVKQAVSVPVFCAGRISPDLGEMFIRQNKLDFIGVTTRLLADPEMPNKLRENRTEDIRPCIGCLHCLDVRMRDGIMECQVNSALGREREYAVKPANKPKKVIIIGGGPSGLEAARITSLNGHNVTMFETSSRLGGLIPMAAMVKDLEMNDLFKFIRYLKTQCRKQGVNININKNISPATIKKLKPDVLILAAGAAPNNFNIPGSDRPDVVLSSKLHKQLKFFMKFLSPRLLKSLTYIWMPIGKRVVVIGGDIIGCELSEFLIKRGREVTIVHDGDTLGEGITKDDLGKLLPWMFEKGVQMFTRATCKKIDDKGLEIVDKTGERKTIKADTIIAALPFVPNTELVKMYKEAAQEIYVIGNCARPGLIVNAIADGARIGHSI